MKSRIVRIGNSKGVRLPKPLLAEAGLGDEIDIAARNGTIVISPISRPRASWLEAARRAQALQDDRLLDEPTPTRFDDEEWSW